MNPLEPNFVRDADQPRFTTTHWTAIMAAASDDRGNSGADQALEQLCRSYWTPLYVFARRRGQEPEDAQDVVQAFFLHLLENRLLAGANRNRGLFRTYLLGCFGNFLANIQKHNFALKRGGAFRFVPLDDMDPPDLERVVAAQDWSPECAYDVAWALAVVERAVQGLRAEAVQRHKLSWFDELRRFLPHQVEAPTEAGATVAEPYGEVADRLGISLAALKTAVHRLRVRFRELVREEIARTVEAPDEIDAELRYLRSTLGLAYRARR